MTNKVIAVMQDLMFMVRIQEIAKRSGLPTVAVKGPKPMPSRKPPLSPY